MGLALRPVPGPTCLDFALMEKRVIFKVIVFKIALYFNHVASVRLGKLAWMANANRERDVYFACEDRFARMDVVSTLARRRRIVLQIRFATEGFVFQTLKSVQSTAMNALRVIFVIKDIAKKKSLNHGSKELVPRDPFLARRISYAVLENVCPDQNDQTRFICLEESPSLLAGIENGSFDIISSTMSN